MLQLILGGATLQRCDNHIVLNVALAAEGTVLAREMTLFRNLLVPRSVFSYCNFSYSAFACFKTGRSGSASFQAAKKSW